MVGWLVGWLVGLVGWLVGWLVACLLGWLVACLCGWSVVHHSGVGHDSDGDNDSDLLLCQSLAEKDSEQNQRGGRSREGQPVQRIATYMLLTLDRNQCRRTKVRDRFRACQRPPSHGCQWAASSQKEVGR